jgi:hypothetical protein
MFFGRSDTPRNLNEAKKDEDYLDVQAYEKGLYKFVRHCETPMTIGLQGEWGSGKTSMMRGVERRLRTKTGRGESPTKENQDESVLPFWFDTWQYGAVGAADTLGMLLLRDLTNRLMRELEEGSVLQYRHRIGRALRSAIPQAAGAAAAIASRSDLAGGAVSAVADTAIGASDSDVRSCFEELVKAALKGKTGPDPRVVVFIDDLDRVPPKLAVQLLEVLKNFMDVESCVFVVACDYEVVREGVHGLMGIDDESDKQRRKEKVDAFFHKLFQVQFLMPVGAYQIDKLFDRYARRRLEDGNRNNTLLGKSYHTNRYEEFLSSGYVKHQGERLHNGWFQELTRVVETAIGTNPRAFKRFLNLIDLTCCVDEGFGKDDKLARWKIGKPDLDEQTLRWFTALFPVTALQQRWPDVSAYLLNGALHRSRTKSSFADAQYTDFERRLRTLTRQWPEVEEDSVIADQFVAEDFRILLAEVFGCDVHDPAAPAAALDLIAFAKAWFRLLNADGDHVLSEEELKTIGRWSKRLGNMGATRIQITGMGRFYELAMDADDKAGDAFFGLASRLINLCSQDSLDYIKGSGSDTGAYWTIRRNDRNPTTLMSLSVKGDKLDIQLNVREGAKPVQYFPGVVNLATELEQTLKDCGVSLHKTQQRLHVRDFGKDYSAEREQPVRDAFVTFLRSLDQLATEHAERREASALNQDTRTDLGVGRPPTLDGVPHTPTREPQANQTTQPPCQDQESEL